MAQKTKKQLAITASVDGAGNVVKSIGDISDAVADLGNTTNSADKTLSGIGSAFDNLGGSQIANVTSKLSPLIDGFGKLGGQVNALGKGIGGMLGVLGPWGMAIGFAVDAATKLYDVLADGEKKTNDAKKSVDDLAAAYDKLGKAADIATARRQVAADKALATAKAEFNTANDTAQQQEQSLQAAIHRYNEAEKTLKNLEAQNETRGRAYVMAQREIYAAKTALDQEKKRLEYSEKLVVARAKQYDVAKKDAGEQQRLAEAEKARQDAQKKAAEEAEKARKDAEARAKAAAEKRAAEIRAEDEYLKQLRLRSDEEIFAAEQHSDLEKLDRQTELALQVAEAAIKDEYKLAAARDAIWGADAAKRQKIETDAAKKGEEERAKWISEARQRATEAGTGDQSDAQVMKLTSRIEKLNQDLAKFRQMSEAELQQYADDYQATQDALIASEEARNDRYRQLAAERGQVMAREVADEKKARMEQVRANYALTESQKETVKAQQAGLQAMTEGLEAWGKGSTVIKVAQMTASGLQAVCDAIDYGAEAAANFAVGNVAAGVGLTAAAAGKTAAAAKYAASLVELGANGFDTGGSSAADTGASSQGTAALTGGTPQSRTTEINVTMQFAGQAGRLGRYLIEDINAEANTPGGARIESRVLR